MPMEMWTQLFGGSDFYGRKPNVPEYATPTQIGTDAIKANQANLPAAQKVASQTNAFNVQQLQSMLRSIMPGYDNIQGTQSDVIQSMLRGEIPKDVQDAVVNAAAAKAVGGGYGGSGMHRNLVARDFGMTSFDITQRGLDSATRWMAQSAAMASPLMMDVSSMFISPALSADIAQSKFQRDLYAEGIAAAPDPVKRGRADQEAAIFASIMSAVGGIAGAAACWVAREVYGPENPKWTMYRIWLLGKAPLWFRRLYILYGERFAAWVSDKPKIKSVIRRWMNKRIEGLYGAWTTELA